MQLFLENHQLHFFLGGLGLFLLWETFFPRRPTRTRRMKRVLFHGAVAVFNSVLIRFTTTVPLALWAVWVKEHQYGILPWLKLDGTAELVLSLVLLDGFSYLWHRLNHDIKFLWRFHQIHHADTQMDVTTSLRFHPGEFLLSEGMKAIWILLLGPSLGVFLLFEILISMAAQFHHSNIDLGAKADKGLRAIFVTPRFHTAHHTVTPYSRNGNYSTLLSVWDRVFQSYHVPEKENLSYLGLPLWRKEDLSFRVWLLGPLHK